MDIAIVGVGHTPPARRSPKSIRHLAIEAIQLALDDAGLDAADIDGVITDGVIMPPSVPREFIAAQFGMTRSFDGGVSFGGAGVASAPELAKLAIGAGKARTVLFYFGVDWGSRASGPYGFHDMYPAKMAFEKPYGFNAQPSYFALWARRYMHEYGMTDADLAAVAISHREHALRNPAAQARTPMTLESYRAARMVAEPLRVPDCCLISDGVGAFIMTSLERARDLRQPPVKVLGSSFASEAYSGDDIFTQQPEIYRITGAQAACRRALGEAGAQLADVDFAELYDCFTISVLMQLEDLGFCARGESPAFVRERGIGPRGALPVNTHGGLLSHSYLLGVEHMIEAVRQLRGAAGAAQLAKADIGLVGGWSIPDYGVCVLGRDVR
ncbi:MAG: thiolase family protein [Proteobacteria bacterium]|nr:thiolase family protein [Pseudomonadota bacterium]